MSDATTLLALFQDVDPAADAIEKLREMGLSNDQMNVVSGIPFQEEILGRPIVRTHVPRIALGGAIAGFAIAVFLIWGVPLLYPLYVGGQPMFPIPPLLVLGFELIMLGMLTSAFLGVFIDSRFPSYEPALYAPEVSDGKIALFFDCPADKQVKFKEAMKSLGAESVRMVEAQEL